VADCVNLEIWCLSVARDKSIILRLGFLFHCSKKILSSFKFRCMIPFSSRYYTPYKI
jgi:hypothetical protein